MRRTPLPRRESSSTTTEVDSKLQVKENNHLFNHVDRPGAEHYVRVSNTMIKVTYKKALKDQNASDYVVDCGGETIFKKSMSCSEAKMKSGHVEGGDLCSGEESPKTKPRSEGGKAFAHHSSPKASVSERQKKYANGVDLSGKSDDRGGRNSPVKVQKVLSPQGEGGSTSKRTKASPVKGTKKSGVEGKRFLKNGDKLVKSKGSIIRRNSTEAKTVSKNSSRIKKIENGVKKKADVERKGLKRKASGTEGNEVAKKIKMNRSKSKEGGEGCKGRTGKKAIMEVDPDLPSGWSRYIRTKNKGSANEQYVVYVVSPQGKKFRFKWQLRKFLEQTKSSLDVDRFFFGLYSRPRSSNASAVDRNAESRKGGPASRGEGSRSSTSKGVDEKGLLLTDPDLPFGWRRVIHTNASSGRKQVHIISPDGKIFRRRYRLSEYLTKHQYNHNLDRFHFGLYPKKEGSTSDNSGREPEDRIPSPVKNEPKSGVYGSCIVNNRNLPEGWKRLIRIRSSSVRPRQMEVVIVSPDGRRHRSKKDLDQYLLQLDSKYKAEDFGFHTIGRSKLKGSESSPGSKPESAREAEPDAGSNALNLVNTKRKLELEKDPLKENNINPEGHMIDSVNALMMSCGLSSPRKVRRQRLPREVHEKQVKCLLNSEEDASPDGCEIPTHWIQRLVKCRTDLRTLEPDAASAIGKAAEEFLKKISFMALSISKDPDRGLTYEDLAELVDRSGSLSPLQTLIPKKITYREYMRLNRPQQYWTFT